VAALSWWWWDGGGGVVVGPILFPTIPKMVGSSGGSPLTSEPPPPPLSPFPMVFVKRDSLGKAQVRPYEQFFHAPFRGADCTLWGCRVKKPRFISLISQGDVSVFL